MLINSPLNSHIVVNPRNGYPSMDIQELLGTVRLDKSKGDQLLASKVQQAMTTVNREINLITLTPDQIEIYKRAVGHEASALIAEDNLDFDTSTTGQIRGENGLAKVTSLRREVTYCIADILGKKRNRVKLL